MNAEQERRWLLRDLAPAGLPWRTHNLLLRCVLFALTLAGAGLLWFLLDTFDLEKPGLVVGPFAIALAEALIRFRRWWWTGIEEALWLAGTFALVSALPT